MYLINIMAILWPRWLLWLRLRVVPRLVSLMPALALLYLGFLSLALFVHHAQATLDAEDAFWIRGIMISADVRTTQQVLLAQIARPLFGHRIELFYLLAIGLHALIGFLVYAVFTLFFSTIRVRFSSSRLMVHLGAMLAGLFFVQYENGLLHFLSAMSYQLVLVFMLAALVFALLHLRSGRWFYWALVLLCYGLALYSHSYALGLPLLLILVEWVFRRSTMASPGLAAPIVRHALMLGLLSVFLKLTGLRLINIAARYLADSERPGQSLMHLANYLIFVVKQYDNDQFTRVVSMGHDRLVFLMACGAVSGWAAFRLVGSQRLIGPSTVLVLFYLVWSGLSFFQTLATGSYEAFFWRYYYNVPGLALVMGFGATWVLFHLGRLAPVIPCWPLLLLALLLPFSEWGLPGVIGHMKPENRRLLHALVEKRSLGPLYPRYRWDPSRSCTTRRRLHKAELRRLARTGADLRCTDLRNRVLDGFNLDGVDLSGSDLSGATLKRASLAGTRLHDAALTWVDLAEARLTGADLREANLLGATLHKAEITGARFDGARLVGTYLQGAFDQERGSGHKLIEQIRDVAWKNDR